MKRILAALVLTLFTLMTVAAQDYTLPDDLQPITAESAAQLTPLAQLGSGAPRGVLWSPNGQTLLAATDDGTYRYQLDDLDNGEFFAGMTDVHYNATGTYAISNGHLLDGESFEVINGDGNQRFSADGSVMVTYEMVGDSPMMHFADAETLVEFGAMWGSGFVVLSEDRRRAALWSGGYYLDDADYTWLPYHMELWDIETNMLLAEDDYTLDYFYPPQFNGKWLIVGDNGDLVYGSIQVWDAETGELVMEMPSSIVNTSPTISPDGRFMLLEGYGTRLISLGVEMSPMDTSPDSDYESRIYNGVFSADGALLATETVTGIALYDASQTPPLAFAEIESENLIMFGNHDNVLLTHNDEGGLSLWDVDETSASLRFTIEIVQGSTGTPRAFSPDDSLLLTSDGRLIDTATGAMRYGFPESSSPKFNGNWSQAAYWSNGALTMVDTSTSEESVLMTIENNLGRLLEINTNSELALFHGDDLIMRGYELRTGDLRFEVGDAVNARFSEDGTRLVATAAGNASTTIWDVAGTTPVAMLTIDAPLRISSISADGHLFAYITTPEPPINDNTVGSYTIEVWDVDSATQITQRVVESRTIPRLGFSPDSQLLTILLFDTALFCPTAADDTPCTGIFFHVDSFMHPERVLFSPDGETVGLQLYMAGPDGGGGTFLYMQSLERILTEEIAINGYDDVTHHVASLWFSPDGAFMLTTDGYPAGAVSPERLRLRDITGAELFVFDGLPVAAFSPDSQLVATDGVGVLLWDVDALRTGEAEPLVSLESNNARGLAFNADGTLLFVYEPRRVTVWGVTP